MLTGVNPSLQTLLTERHRAAGLWLVEDAGDDFLYLMHGTVMCAVFSQPGVTPQGIAEAADDYLAGKRGSAA